MARITITLPERFPFSTEFPLRIADINYGGHLGNDSLLSILHEARLRFLGEFGFTEKNAGGAGLIMVDVAVVYRAEAFHGDTLLVDIAVTDVHKKGCDFVYRVRRRATNTLIAEAKTGMMFFDYDRRRVAAMPEPFRLALVGEPTPE